MKEKLLLIFLIFLSTSCIYNPSGEHFIEPNEPEKPVSGTFSFTNSIENNGLTSVYDGVYVSYSFDIDERVFYEINAWIDDDSINTFELDYGIDGTLFMNTNLYSNGLHNLNFSLITSSGSKSIADQIGVELIRTKISVPVFFDNAFVSSTSFNQIGLKDGALQIDWKLYERPNFRNYRLERLYQSFNSQYSTLYSIPIPSGEIRYTNSVIDHSYIGGTSILRLGVTDNDYNLGFSNAFVFEDNYPQFIRADTVGNSIELTWSKCKYYSSFGVYILENLASRESWIIDSVSDTTFIDQIRPEFDSVTYRLITSPENRYISTKSTIDEITLR